MTWLPPVHSPVIAAVSMLALGGKTGFLQLHPPPQANFEGARGRGSFVGQLLIFCSLVHVTAFVHSPALSLPNCVTSVK